MTDELYTAINLDGAVAVLVDESTQVEINDSEFSVPILRINKLTQLVSEIAGRFYGNPSQQLNIAAFTGTNGKTTCSQLYAQLMARVSVDGESIKSAYIGTTGYGVAESEPENNPEETFKGKQDSHQLTTPNAVSAQRILQNY